MFSRSLILIKQCGSRSMSSRLGRMITSQSAYLVSEETPLTKFFAGVPKLETIEPRKLWINDAMESMTSIDEAKEILMNFQQNHYFINNKAIKSFVKNGMNMDIRKTIDVICDPAISLTLSDVCIQLIKKKLNEEGDGDYLKRFEQYIDSQKEKATAEKDEEYVPYEHLRTVTEDSSFYTMEFKVDIDKDILGKYHYLLTNNLIHSLYIGSNLFFSEFLKVLTYTNDSN